MYLADKDYIQILAQNLKVSNPKDLDIVMGPEELKNLLREAEAKDFLGTHPWINLHTHSMASDGKLSPTEWVNNAFNWMQKNHLIQYVVALTDHDTVEGLIPVLKYVVKNRSHLKGLRVVLGCELSTSFEDEMLRRPLDFEILHYGINPFDKKYGQLLKQQAQNRHRQLSKLFEILGKKYPWLSANLKGYQASFFYGANMQKGLGVNWFYDTMSYFKSLVPQGSDLSQVSDDMLAFGFQCEKKEMWFPVQKLLGFIKDHGGFASMAHPYRLQ